MAILNTRAADYAVADTWADGYTIDAPAAVFAFNSSALVIPVVFADAALSAEFAAAIQSLIVQSGTLSLLSSTAIAATAETVLGAPLSIDVEFNSTATAETVQGSSAALDSTVSAAVSALTVKEGFAEAAGSAALTAAAGAALAVNPTFDSLFSPAVTAIALRDNESLMAGVFGLTAQFAGVQDVQLELNTVGSVSTAGLVIRDSAAALAGEFTSSALNTRIQTTLAQFNSSTAMVLLDDKVIAAESDLTVTANLSAAVIGLIESSTDLFAYNNLTIGVELSAAGFADAASEFALAGAGETVKLADATLNSQSTATVAATAITSGAAAVPAEFALNTAGIIIKNADSTAISTAVLAAIPQRIILATVDFNSTAFAELAANIGRADPYRTVKLNPETRTVTVLTEDRTLIVLGPNS